MASAPKVSILDYFNIVFEGENGKIESNCKACGTRIQAKRSVTSNFVTHLKVMTSKIKCLHGDRAPITRPSASAPTAGPAASLIVSAV